MIHDLYIQNLYELGCKMNQHCKTTSFTNQSQVAVYTGVPYAFMNMACSINPNETEEGLKEIINFFREQKKVDFLLLTHPKVESSQLVSLKTLCESEVSIPFYLAKASEIDLSYKSELKIKKVSCVKTMDDFVQAFFNCFEFERSHLAEVKDFFWDLFQGDEKAFEHFVGYYEDEPVAVASSSISKDYCGFYNVAVLKKYRGKNFGRDITSASIRTASEQGVPFFGCTSTPDGEHLYRKMGFKNEFDIPSFKG